jgi:hypothetical protein
MGFHVAPHAKSAWPQISLAAKLMELVADFESRAKELEAIVKSHEVAS